MEVRSKISTEIRDKTGVCHDPREIRCSKCIFSLIPLNNTKKSVESVCPSTNNWTTTWKHDESYSSYSY
jgi:hypothetical protein